MGSSASAVRFSEVPEKVPKVPEEVREALVQSQVRFNRVPEKVPEKVWEALVQIQIRFNRVLEKVPEKVWTLDKVPEKVLGIFGAGPGQVQRVPEIRRLRRRLQIGFGENCFSSFCFHACAHCVHVKIKRRGCWGYPRSLFSWCPNLH